MSAFSVTLILITMTYVCVQRHTFDSSLVTVLRLLSLFRSGPITIGNYKLGITLRSFSSGCDVAAYLSRSFVHLSGFSEDMVKFTWINVCCTVNSDPSVSFSYILFKTINILLFLAKCQKLY